MDKKPTSSYFNLVSKQLLIYNQHLNDMIIKINKDKIQTSELEHIIYNILYTPWYKQIFIKRKIKRLLNK